MSDMGKERARLLLHAELDGELDAASAIELERMLSSDPRLAAEFARLEALRQVVRSHARRQQAPASLRARLMEATATALKPRRRSWREPPSWRAFAASMAATAALTFGLQHSLYQDAPDATLRAVVSGHMRGQISGQPTDVASSDRHMIKPWLAAKLPVAAVVVDLAAEGFPLIGGRVDIVAGAAAPTLVYKRREHLISVTQLRADAGDYSNTPQRRALNGYPVVVWSDGANGYVAVSDLSQAEFDIFVDAFRKAAAKERG